MADTNGTFSSAIVLDRVINYAFQQNAIPIIKELRLHNDATQRFNLSIRISTEPPFAEPMELRLQSLAPDAEHSFSPLDLKLSPDYLGSLTEKVSGLLHVNVVEQANGEPEKCIHASSESISLLARNEWSGLVSLSEILAAFVLPNDPAIMPLLGRAAEILGANTGRSALNAYQDKSPKRVWEQMAAIYKAMAELGIRYITPPASFETTGQKVRFPSDVISQKFGTCLDLALLFAACFEQAGLHPLLLSHEGHMYVGCWLQERTLPESSTDDLQQMRKLAADELITVFDTTIVTDERPGTLLDAERLARPHLETTKPFRFALDIRAARIARIHPLPVPGQLQPATAGPNVDRSPASDSTIGSRDFVEALDPTPKPASKPATRIDQWKSRLLDLSLRNRLLNFRPTRQTIPILSASPEHVEDELAAEAELALQPKPKLMSEKDPRDAATYTQQQRADAIAEHLRDELKRGRLHTSLDESEHGPRLTELYRAARLALDENGSNTLYAAVGILEWRETEHSERVLRAPLLLVPVQLKRKSVLEGFTLRRLDEETRLNFTLMEMLRQQFQKEIPALDTLPEDERGVNVAQVFQLFREAVRDLAGWEVKSEIWLSQFSFTKFLLWKDLNDRLDALTQNRVVNHLVNDAGQQFPNPPNDILPEHLDDKFHPRDIYCPRSADSSQLAAVLAAADGHDFVLEGPPGTGKSQTITNIIAHCLAIGKRVLFVAEKRAALDVVYRRLREEGLEPFCLELHSNKAGKAEVVAQFDRTLKFVNDTSVPDWDRRASELGRLRAKLNDYARRLHFCYPCGLSAYLCLDYLLPRQTEPVVRLDDWDAIEQTPLELLERARELARLLMERSGPLQPLANHPLSALRRKDWSPDWAERTLALAGQLADLARRAETSTGEFLKWLNMSGAHCDRSQLGHMALLAECLLAPHPVGPSFATTPWNQLAANLSEWTVLVEERSYWRTTVTPALRQSSQMSAAVTPATTRLAFEDWTPTEAAATVGDTQKVLDLVKQASTATRDLHVMFQISRPGDTRAQFINLIGLVDSLLGQVPVAPAFATTSWSEIVVHLDTWIALTRERAELRRSLRGYNEIALLAQDLNGLQVRWQQSQSSWFLPKWLATRNVRSHLHLASPGQPPPQPGTFSATLKAALRLREINAAIAEAKTVAEDYLGRIWAAGEPDLDSLVQVRSWGEALHARTLACAGDDAEWLTTLRRIVAELFRNGPESYAPGTPAGDRLQRFRDAVTQFDTAFDALNTRLGLRQSTLDEAPDHLAAVSAAVDTMLRAVERTQKINAGLTAAAPAAHACLGHLWNNSEPSFAALKLAHVWGEQLHSAVSKLAGENLLWLEQFRQSLAALFNEGPNTYAHGTTIGDRLSRFREHHEAFENGYARFAEAADLDRTVLDKAPNPLARVRELCEALPAVWPKLRHWCFWQRARQQAVELGLTPVVLEMERPQGTLLDVPALFERSFRKALLFAIVDKEPALKEFFGSEHSERIDRFCRLDDKLAELTRDLIRTRLAGGIPSDMVQHDIPKTELGLLRKEIGKKMRHIPVRQLLGRIPTLMPRLKPCVLMSPLSVAQYLEPAHQQFDVVIFDEASQIPVWDAVGAIARGKQLIVVGDPKQLPPTNFFSTADDDEPAEVDLSLQQDLESILDELMTNGLRHKRLKWHYRSRHEGLIAFSNQQYYANDLLTFPSPETQLGGVRFIHLPEARYDKGKSRTNLSEAKALVAELVQRLRKTKGTARSYGVVTFSLAQQQLVENLLDEERRKYPEIEAHFGDEPPVDGEPVFVKNLENVQGDERDIILFSICYGPDEAGRISMNFGPINKSGGQRRLNVAITRAKHEVIVFSSLRPEQIDLTRTRSEGVRDLKLFLDYAERGPKALTAAAVASPDRAPDSEFERLVADRIRATGYEVHHQVGCSGYRIDLGILDPKAPGRYLLGIECDGATYHRAATARDRDKLRQLILEGLGWKLHRIWSTDWWHAPETEMEKLLSVLESL